MSFALASPRGPTFAQGTLAHPVPAASMASSRFVVSSVRSLRMIRAASYSLRWSSSKAVPTVATILSIGIGVLDPSKRRTKTASPLAASRGPTSIRMGYPFNSASMLRRPNATSTRSSSPARESRVPEQISYLGSSSDDVASIAGFFDGHHQDLCRCEPRWNSQTVIITMHHDHAPDHARR